MAAVEQHRLKKSRECTDTHVSSHSFVKGFTVKQHRLEKQRTHRHPCVIAILGKDLLWNRAGWISRERTDTRCVIAILWKGFYVEQLRLEKQRTHRHSCVIAILCERIYCGTEQVGEVENAQTLDVSSQSFGKDFMWNSSDWKSRERTDTHVSSQSFVKGFTVKQHRLEKQRTYRHSDVSSQSFRKDLMWNNTGWISRERTDTQCVIAIL